MSKNIKSIFLFLLTLGLCQTPIIAQRFLSLINSESSLRLFIDQGKSSQVEGNFDRAINFFSRAHDLARRTKRSNEKIACLFNLGVNFWNKGDIQESAVLIKSAYVNANENANTRMRIHCQQALEFIDFYSRGKECRSRNSFVKSIRYFLDAIHISQELNIKGFELKCLRQLSITHWLMDDYDSFLECNEEALEIAIEIFHTSERGRCLNNIGVYYEKLYNYSKALGFFEQAIQYLRSSNDAISEAECLSNMGLAYKDLGHYEKALIYLEKAAEIDRQLKDLVASSIDYGNIGSVYLRKGIIEGSRTDIYQSLLNSYECMRIINRMGYESIEIAAINNIGIAYRCLGENEKALEYYKRAERKLHNDYYAEEKCNLFNNLGNIYLESRRIELAIAYFKKSLDLFSSSDNSAFLWETYLGFGECYKSQENVEKALYYYQMAIDAIEKIRSSISLDIFKIGYIRNKLLPYQRVIEILYEAYMDKKTGENYEKLFLAVEKFKARAFLETLQEGYIDARNYLEPGLKKKEIEISNRISLIYIALSKSNISDEEKEKLCTDLEQSEDAYLRLLSIIRAKNYTAADILNPRQYSLHQIRTELLYPQIALLEYYISDNYSFLFFITKNELELYELPTKSDLENILSPFFKSLSDPSNKYFFETNIAEKVARILLPPLIHTPLDEINSLIVIPDDVLHFLPFESLTRVRLGDTAYLVQDYAISYSPSSSVLVYLVQNKSNLGHQKSFLAVGSPEYEGSASNQTKINEDLIRILREVHIYNGFNYSYLPYSKIEILSIARFFPEARRDLLIGKAARESVLKDFPIEEYRIIHFACHSFLDFNNPLRSALVLIGEENKKEDGFLQAREVYNLTINADLVVLSACQTGRGPIESSEGIIGLPRMFFYAGARSLVSSLWQVNDKATAFFMRNFYKYLSEGASKTRALRSAKLKMLNSSWDHPFYWACFVLSGEYASPVDFH